MKDIPEPKIPLESYAPKLANYFQITPFGDNYCILDFAFTEPDIPNTPRENIIYARFLIHNSSLSSLSKMLVETVKEIENQQNDR